MAKSSKRVVPVVDEVVVEKAGMSFEDGIVLSTTLVLLVALVLAYLQYSSTYGS